MKQHHPLLRRMLCAALALAVACMGTPALAKSIPALDPEMTVNSSHAIYYGSEASLADGVYGAQENVDGEGWVYVQTAADGTDNHVVFTVDLHETRTVYASGIGTIVNGWAEKMENLTLSASENGTNYTPLAACDNAELAAEWGPPEWACPEGAPVTARYLRYEFDIATSQITDGAVHYVCVDEIDVRTEADTPEPPPVVDPDPGDCVNLAAGRPYTSAWAASGSYADDGGQLTDGVYSRALSCKAPEWVGYYNEVQDGFEFIVDLGESKRFEQVKMNFLREEGSGIPTPYSVRIELSDDSASWRTLAQTDVAPIIEGNGIKRFVCRAWEKCPGRGPVCRCIVSRSGVHRRIGIDRGARRAPIPPDDLPAWIWPTAFFGIRAAAVRRRHDPDGQCDGRPCLERLRLAELQRHKSRRTRRQPHSDGI
ncbi:MAG: discoidin domain-containing protein [Ruthenibacterium lactatiformans]